jgi:hypothetical protein
MVQTTTWQVAAAPTGLAMRQAVNEQVAALQSNNSGPTAPTVTVAGMSWFDTSSSPGVLKKRNSANTAWMTDTDSPTFTGTVTIPTPADGDNTTKAASTAFVTSHAMPKATTSSGIGLVQSISPAAGAAYVVPSGGTWFVSAQQIGTSGTATLVQARGIYAGGTSLGAPGAGYAWTGFAWRIS